SGDPAESPMPGPAPSPAPSRAPASPDPYARPDWLGTRVLPTTSDGFGEVPLTPEELRDRRLATVDLLPPPESDEFATTVGAVPDDVIARSTWFADCPVTLDDLRYVTVSFWGFDERHHTGELLVNASAAEDLVEVFRRLHGARFPIEEMRVVAPEELDAPPTGDGNNTTAFVCRPSVGSSSWSEHAYGLALDVNPFHNPYLKGEIVLPELAPAYTDRDWERPGMILSGDAVTEAFAAIGWEWGGNWHSAKDWMHFSLSGR
ncbi:MAG: M15 family metallopeptidase, partial [Nitriliruptorales bacterium]